METTQITGILVFMEKSGEYITKSYKSAMTEQNRFHELKSQSYRTKQLKLILEASLQARSAIAEKKRVEEEKTHTVEQFVHELLEKGYAELQSPPDLEGRKFFITCRRMKLSTVSSSKNTAFRGNSLATDVNEFMLLDLFEQFIIETKPIYLPVGMGDYRIAYFDDGNLANGNFSLRQLNQVIHSSKPPWPLDNQLPVNWFTLADNFSLTNGVKILKKEALSTDVQGYANKQDITTGNMLKQLKDIYKDQDEPWRKHGLGKLMISLGILAVESIGVQELDFYGSRSELAEALLIKLGFIKDKNRFPRQTISSFKKDQLRENVYPFVPQKQ